MPFRLKCKAVTNNIVLDHEILKRCSIKTSSQLAQRGVILENIGANKICFLLLVLGLTIPLMIKYTTVFHKPRICIFGRCRIGTSTPSNTSIVLYSTNKMTWKGATVLVH